MCDEHRADRDLSIEGDVVVRRIRIRVDVLITGASLVAQEAQLEAVEQLQRAVRALGGHVDVDLVTSQVVRYPASLQQGVDLASGGIGR